MKIAAHTRDGLDLSDICEEDKITILKIYKMMQEEKKKKERESQEKNES